jgi:membrane-associated phospholipid phosphatase
LSRLYVGEHWLTDVVAGYAVGTAVLATALHVHSTTDRRKLRVF